MEALLILTNFLAMGYIILWCSRANRLGDPERRKGLLGYGDRPNDKGEKRKPKYWRN